MNWPVLYYQNLETHLPFRCCYNSGLMRSTFKGTERPINQTIYREFNGISVLWDPIYAPVDLERHPYGTVLIPESTLETTAAHSARCFLTSRGMISIPINDLARTMGITGTIDQSAITEEILRKFNQFVKPSTATAYSV